MSNFFDHLLFSLPFYWSYPSWVSSPKTESGIMAASVKALNEIANKELKQKRF